MSNLNKGFGPGELLKQGIWASFGFLAGRRLKTRDLARVWPGELKHRTWFCAADNKGICYLPFAFFTRLQTGSTSCCRPFANRWRTAFTIKLLLLHWERSPTTRLQTSGTAHPHSFVNGSLPVADPFASRPTPSLIHYSTSSNLQTSTGSNVVRLQTSDTTCSSHLL